jgi:exopolyphosphatase/guanosine-5'-triphosphate,3'-diphosphate pyrophosphatase
MAEIMPRWEWRTFGSGFGSADAYFASQVATGVQESDELYLLSGREANVKIRDDLMDIKVLRETDAAGLQRWEPILKTAFPLDADQARTVFSALGHDRSGARESWTLEELLAEVAKGGGVTRAATTP